jgi:large subunit ribosomal protein L35Ae
MLKLHILSVNENPSEKVFYMSESEVLKGRKGVVTSYRRGLHLQHPNQVLLLFDGIKTRAQAAALVSKKVKWVSPTGKEFLGKVLGPHGNSGAVRAKFRTNLPGQAIGTPVELL